MSMIFTEPGRILDAAKQAALDAVRDYGTLNPYTVGVAVQAAAAVLLRSQIQPPSARHIPDAWDVESVEVTPRLRALESVAFAARLSHGLHDGSCELCTALAELEQAS